MTPIWTLPLKLFYEVGDRKKRRAVRASLAGLAGGILALAGSLTAPPAQAETQRIVHADIVALDHLLVYNRFGSFNPFGMIFALRRDVTSMSQISERPSADLCAALTGAEAGEGKLEPGEARLRDCKRPRPLVLRANAGDILEITLTNLLRPDQPGVSSAFATPPQKPGIGFCEEKAAGDGVAIAPVRPDIRTAFGNIQCAKTAEELAQEAQAGSRPGTDWPLTRGLSLVIPGLEPIPADGGKIHGACTGLDAIKPGESVTCRWQLLREGTHLFSSLAAPAGGEGDAGSLGHGLFGALIVEATGSRAFRSQVSRTAFERVWPSRSGAVQHARADAVDFNLAVPDSEAASRVSKPVNGEAFACGGAGTTPILSMRRPCATRGGKIVEEIVHGDLNAVIVPPAGDLKTIDEDTPENLRREWRQAHEAQQPFREFTVIFHDELKTYYAEDLKQLGMFGQLSGVRDGFAINYGASGVGSAMLANRLGIGPAANCAECLYEEFFLESWANGDPALLEAFPDDPSNVHHSYLNDKVVFRNFHAGKETHVFHLHSHQWFAGNDAGRGAYLDSQTIGPQQGFTYRIYHGGLERFAADRNSAAAPRGWWDSLGSGNRNRTPGDAIFHCHLYPHFAQGMWALWRVHDVLEDGTRLLPDGQSVAALSVLPNADKEKVRQGSVGRAGEWLAPPGGKASDQGTPVPGLIPLPGQGLPLLPTYSEPAAVTAVNNGQPLVTDAMPGYPFYVAGKPGRRSPQPPLDMARAEKNAAAGIGDSQIAALGGRAHLDGGLPRHVVVGGEAVPTVLKDLPPAERQKIKDKKGVLARMLALGDVTSEFEFLKLELLPQIGTVLERNAMAFHGTGSGLKLFDASGREPAERTVTLAGDPSAPALPPLKTRLDPDTAAYPVKSIPLDTIRSGATGAVTLADDARFAVNGSPGAAGSPYADPCSAPLVFSRENGPKLRRFNAAKSTWEGAEPFKFQIDPFTTANSIVPDPALIGFRRFDVSVVELKMIVNRAGWHDPQARINVLSTEAGNYKNKWRSDAEPFFFRAFSGECIEFHHTNETPKKLKLDDFQLSVPTDTIGQHIHLVKFDVTSSDGSGNGFNYEDGTFASDEVLERLCKSRAAVGGAVTNRPGEVVAESAATRSDGECAKDFVEKVSTLPRLSGDNIKYFQTTVQRWFADPILSDDGPTPGTGVADRTMRTVFTHDHFGPSNIQQHGFYSALLIEPSTHAVCPLAEANSAMHDGKNCATGPAASNQPTGPYKLAQEPARDLVGARANVFLPRPPVAGSTVAGDPIHVDAREYAIAIADFALLYDGKKGVGPATDGDPNGLDRLVYEAAAAEPTPSAEDEPDETAPARFLRLQDIALSDGDRGKLTQRRGDIRAAYGNPIAPPPRPEAISQRHHDPYLVNYRNEPIPLRVGAKSDGSAPSFLANPCRVPGPQDGAFADSESGESISRQRLLTDKGDLSDVFRSELHGDPCTPILEGLSGDRVVVRMIQGAQEVQHTFVVEGRPGRRNVDQPFPSERPLGADRPEADVSRAARCASNAFARSGNPREFAQWATEGILTGPRAPYWKDFAELVAGCDNPLGFVAAQEIGISEHFEVGSLFSAGGTYLAPRLTVAQPGDDGLRPIVRSGRHAASGRPSLDYLYHFGSTDALWNGAWGLLRSYDAPTSPDLAACLGTAPSAADFKACLTGSGATAIGKRLASFADLRRKVGASSAAVPMPATSAVVEALPPSVSKLAESCPVGAPHVEAIAVAIRSGKALDKSTTWLPGTIYEKAGLFSRDGLLLVPLTRSDLGLDRPLMAYQAGAPLPKSIPQIQTIVANKLKQAGDTTGTPFVLRVRAGDCVDLMVINALPGSGEPWDTPGDALMPRIVPLNVDSDERQYGSVKSFSDWKQERAKFRDEIDPSRKVALSVPLPSVSLKPAGTLPVGVNDTRAISPEGSGGRVFGVTRYYAGFYWVGDGVVRDKALEALRLPTAQTEIAGQIPNGRFGVELLQEKPCELERQVVVYGVALCIDARDPGNNTIAISATSRGRLQEIAQRQLDTFFAGDAARKAVTRVIPYAFGALPIRSIGDVVSHGARGLIGTVVVEPTEVDAGNNPVGPSPAEAFAWRHSVTAAVPAPKLDLEVPGAAPVTIGAATFREHVLMWQDGLNQWRRPHPTDSYLGFTDRPVPDCRVCDDSYDLGERGVSYRSAPFTMRLAGRTGISADFGLRTYPRDEDDLNTVVFPPNFFAAPLPTPQLAVKPGEEIAIRVTHPEGRARQRAFVATTIGYDDLFPGFGSGHTTLLAPGKAMTAWGCAPRTAGDYLWRDGPQPIFAAGVWGHLSVGNTATGSVSACSLPGVD